MKTTGKDGCARGASGRRLKRACFLLTLAFIILVPSNLPQSASPLKDGWWWSSRLGHSYHHHHQHQHHHPQQPAAPATRGIIFAEANYLDEVGRVSQAMNQFVDALLQKVSFMAEIIIESSMSEQCEASCVAPKLPPSSSAAAASSNGSKLLWLDGGDTLAPQANNIRADRFDRREFTNVNLFLEAARARYDGGAEGGEGGQQTDVVAKCQLFNFDVDGRDLPISEMASCCSSYTQCYSRCGQAKLDCDLQFQVCLRTKCRQKFDYTNETVVRNFRQLEKRRALYREEPLDEPAAEEAELYGSDDDNEEEPSRSSSLDDDDSDDDSDSDSDKGRGKRSSAVDADVLPGPQEEAEKAGKRGDKLEVVGSEREVKRLRDKYKACKLASKVLIIGNLAFGCQKYKRSQWRSCCFNATTSTSTAEDNSRVV